SYEDHDDCLTAAAEDYAAEHGLDGWDLSPRWESEQREHIVLTVPAAEITDEDRAAIKSLAKQDQSGEVDDSYARTGDAEDAIQRWYDSAAEAGDSDLCEIVDRIGLDEAAKLYEAARAS